MDKPEATKDGITFYPVPDVNDAALAFGCGPESYFHRSKLPKVPGDYEATVISLFYKGGAMPKTLPGVDAEKASRLLRAILGSFSPSHESKMATAAYALWVWNTPEIVSAEGV